MIKQIVIIIIIIVILWAIYVYWKSKQINEGYYGDTGQFCSSCETKNANQCLNCFNCGICYDKFGNGKCKTGGTFGPANLDDCAYWKSGDSWGEMVGRNQNYKCSYGPLAANRVIGINPYLK